MGIFEQANQHPVNKQFIGYGDEAIENTLKIMRDLVVKGSGDYYVRRWAEKMVEEVDSDVERVRSIFQFIANNTKYLRDPAGFEFIKSPEVSLRLIELGEFPQMDCDCYTVLILSLLKSIGFLVAMRATSYKPDLQFKHVYGLVKIRDSWIPLDLTKADKGIGWEAPGVTRYIDFKI